MTTHKHIVTLSRPQTHHLKHIIRTGTHKARTIIRARALLASAAGRTDEEIARDVGVDPTTIERLRRRFSARGLALALEESPRSGRPKKLSRKAEQHLIATACTDPPLGADHWTLELLAEQMVNDKQVQSISSVAIMHYLHRNDTKPWREKNVVYPDAHPCVH